MNYRILYHNDKIFFYDNLLNKNEAINKYNLIENDNKILIDLSNNNILEQSGDDNLIKNLIKYNNCNLFKLNASKSNKYHLALYFMGHFLPNCEKLVELQLNNYLNCTFDIFIITERSRVYGRFVNPKKAKNMLNIDNVKQLNKINKEEIIKIFGKYSKNIKEIIFMDDYKDECNEILNDNKIFYKKKFGEIFKRSREIEYFKFLKALHLKNNFKKENPEVKYDFVIKTRPDLILKNQIYFCDEYKNWCKFNFFGRNNIFIIGNEDNMDWLSLVIKYYYRYEGKFGCEFQLYKHALAKKLKFVKKKIKSSKPIEMFRYWILNKLEYFLEHTKKIPDNDKKFWQIY